MKRKLPMLLMATAAMAVQAETLYFTPDGSSSATNKFGKFMFSSDHWTTAAGVRQAPNHGDILVFEKSSQLTANGASGHTAAHVNGMWFKGVMPPISQGEMHMNAGSMGVTNSGTNASCSWYVGMRFYGTGEVPFYLGGTSQITCQRCFYQTDGGTTTLVKLGSGTLAFSDGSNWSETTRGSWAKTRLEGGTIYWSETGSGGKAWDLQVFPIGHELTFADTGAGATFSCGAHDCEFKDITLREASPLLSPSHTLTDAGSTIRYFRFIGTPGLNPMGFGGKVTNTAGIIWNPDSGDNEFVFSNSVSTTTGNLLVSNGTVRVTHGASFTALSGLQLSPGTKFKVDKGAGSGFHAARLDLADSTAELTVDFGVLTFDRVFVAGQEIPTGVYTVENCDWLKGSGYVLVGGASLPFAVDAWWRRADGDATDIPADVATNYTGAALSGEAVTLTAGEDATVVLGDGGLTTAGEGVAYGYAWPTFLGASQTWDIAAGDTVSVLDDINQPTGVAWKKTGAGTLSFVGEKTFAGNLVVSNGTVIARGDDSLGGSAGTTTFELVSSTEKGTLTILPEDGKNEVSFHRPITFHYAVDGEHGNFMSLPANATVNFHGLMQTSNKSPHSGPGWPCHWNYSCPATTVVHWYGGMYAQLNHVFPGGHHYIHKALTGGDRFSISGNAQVELLAANNSVGGATGGISAGTLFTRVPYALDGKSGQNRTLVVNGGRIDLCGNDQALSVLRMTSGQIYSESPAFMRIRGNWALSDSNGGYSSTVTNTVVCTGAAGLSMERTNYPLALSGTSSTTGTLQVVAGTLVVRPAAVWTNASNVAVQGGTMRIESRTAAQGAPFGRQVNVQLDSAGKLDLDCSLKVFSLTLNGVEQRRGTYGSSASGASRKLDDYFLGTGVISVLGDGKGLTLIFR